MDVRKPFWAWVFCDGDGVPSFARVATAVLLAFACGWVTAVVYSTHSLPDFGGVALFITTLYGTNKLTTILHKD